MLMISAHPGEHLRELLDDCGVTARELADMLGVTRGHVEAVLDRRDGMSADFAVRLARWTGQSPEFWVRLDAHHRAVEALRAGRDEIEAITPHGQAA